MRILERWIRGALPFLLALPVACRTASVDDAVTLRFWAMGGEGEAVQQLLPEFERRNPGIRVEVQQIPWSAAHEKLLTAYVGEATPDLTQLGNTWIPEFVALNALEPLGEWLGRSPSVDPNDYFAGIWATNVIGGTVYGVPWYVDTRLLFYRTDLLAEAGYAEPPVSWAGWVEAMRKIKEAGGPDRWAILLPTDEWTQPVILGMQLGAPMLKDDGRFGDFSGPRFRQAFQFYVDLFRQGFAPSVGNTQVANLYQQFADGEFAMYITGPWNIGQFKDRLPAEVQDRWMTAPLPAPGGDAPGISTAGGASLAVFRTSDHKAEAWKLIEYLSAPEQQLRFYQITGDLPPRQSVWQDPSLADNRYAAAFREQLQRVRPTPKVPEWEQIATQVWSAAQAAISGRATVDQALVALDRDVDRILEKRRWMLARAAQEGTTSSDDSPDPGDVDGSGR